MATKPTKVTPTEKRIAVRNQGKTYGVFEIKKVADAPDRATAQALAQKRRQRLKAAAEK